MEPRVEVQLILATLDERRRRCWSGERAVHDRHVLARLLRLLVLPLARGGLDGLLHDAADPPHALLRLHLALCVSPRHELIVALVELRLGLGVGVER